MTELPESFERMVQRRHRLELAVLKFLPAPCRDGLAAAVPGSDCSHCRYMLNHAFLHPAQSDEQVIDTALYHLANVDNCRGAVELRRAEAARALLHHEDAAQESPAPAA